MNGKPMWCRPARTKSYEPPVEINSEHENQSILAEAASLVREGLRKGLIKAALPAVYDAIGRNSEWATCSTCGCQFTRNISGDKKECSSCRLAEKVCIFCGTTFKPVTHRQVTCGEECRRKRQQAAASSRRRPWLVIPCDNCGTPFEKAPASPRKNCSQQCGFASMVKNTKKPKRK